MRMTPRTGVLAVVAVSAVLVLLYVVRAGLSGPAAVGSPTPASGGLGSYDPSDPVAFVGTMLGKAAGIFAVSQIVFHSGQPAIAKWGGTPPPAA